MSFERPLFLLLLLGLIPAWALLARRGPRATLVLKSAVFAVLVVAIAGPWGTIAQKHLGVTVVVDASASMPRASLARAENTLRELVRKNTGAELKVVTFAERAQSYDLPRDPDKVTVPAPAGSVMGTDIEEALHVALSGLPAAGARRILLISDGNETRGHALAAALAARSAGASVSTLAAGGGSTLPVEVESIALPQHVFSGERFTVSLRVDAARDVSGRVALMCQGNEIGASDVILRQGANQVDLDARITGAGVSLLEARISGEGEERVLLSQAISVRRPRVLYVAGRGDSLRPLAEALRRSEVEIQLASSFPVEGAADRWDGTVLDNYPDHPLPAAEHRALEQYVSGGGGLIFVAGQNNSRLAENPKTGLEKVLPVRGDPGPAPEQPSAVVLVLDKSASMDGTKIAMVREAARQSLNALRQIDKIGVIAFDSTFRWVVPMAPASDIARITAAIATINADGGTSIYPALAAAFEAVRRENAARKHIVLLTDGWSTPGEFKQLAQQAAAEGITISAIGVGKELNHDLLETLAHDARGKSYFVDSPESVPQIITGELRELSVSSLRERPFRVVRVRAVEFTDGVDFTRAPRLLGFVKAKAREGSETILATDSGEPLLVRWQFGLGRVVAFLSDAKNRWAVDWLRWSDYGKFWPQVVRDVSRRNRTVRTGVRPGDNEGEAVVSYDLLGDTSGAPPPAFGPGERPRVVVAMPGEPNRSFPLEETAPGHFEARIPADARGMYRIVSGNDEIAVPESGFYRDSAELRSAQINAALLKEISRVSGGRFGATADDLLDPEGSLILERRPLWPYWLVLALLLNFLELALRKGLLARLAPASLASRPAAASGKEPPQPKAA